MFFHIKCIMIGVNHEEEGLIRHTETERFGLLLLTEDTYHHLLSPYRKKNNASVLIIRCDQVGSLKNS